MKNYQLEELLRGKWGRAGYESRQIGIVAERMAECDHEIPGVPRRITLGGETVMAGRWCQRDTPVNDVKIFSIVMSLDKPGPRERDGGAYARHESRADAVAQARKLSANCGGGRFGVLELVHVTGWIDVDLETEIPF